MSVESALREKPGFASLSPSDQAHALQLARDQDGANQASLGGWKEGMDRDIPGFRPYLEAGAQGLLDIPRGIAGLASAVMHPMDTASSIVGLADPATGPQKILSALSPTLGTLASGNLPSGPDVVREAVGTGGSILLGKLLPELSLKGVKAGAEHIPGAQAALHEMAIPEARAVATDIHPGQPAIAGAFKAAEAAGAPPIWMGNFRKTARTLLRRELTLGKASRDQRVVDAMRSFLTDTRQGWGPDKWKAELDRMGAQLGGIGGTEGLSRVHDKQIRTLQRAMYQDVEAAQVSKEVSPAVPAQRVYQQVGGVGPPQWVDIPPQPALHGPSAATPDSLGQASLWQEAQRLARRGHASDELGAMIDKSISLVSDQRPSINVNKALQKIDQQLELAKRGGGPGVKKAKRFVGSFAPGELEQIRTKLDEIGGDLPRIPVGRGAAHGSGGYILRAVLGEIGGEMVGHPAIGTAVALGLPELIAKAAMSDTGRALIKRASKIDPKVGPLFQSTLAAGLRTQIPAGHPQVTPPIADRAPAILSASKAGLIPGPQALREQATERGAMSRGDRSQLLKILPPPPLPTPPAIR